MSPRCQALLVLLALGTVLVDARLLQSGRENLELNTQVAGESFDTNGLLELSDEDLSSPNRRSLLQSKCTQFVGCKACKTVRILSNTTDSDPGKGNGNGNGGGKKGKSVLVCAVCNTGFSLFKDVFPPLCNCGAGLFNNGTACTSCPRGKFCDGAKNGKGASPVESCPPGLTTYIDGAKSQAQCMTTGGYGRVAKRNPVTGRVTYESVVCPKGTYNIGKNAGGCVKCGAGLTTASEASDSAGKCGAPKGTFVRNGVAVKCPKGTFAPSFGNQTVCSACSDGTTTSVAEGGDSTLSCNRATRGRKWDPVTRQGVPCDLNTYMDEETESAVCKPCPGFWRTEYPGAEGPASCVAPPGMELKANATYNATNLTLCEIGFYKEGWNRNPCLSCGIGLLTAVEGAVIQDECFIPAGWGIVPSSVREGRMLEGRPCVQNTYGWATSVFNIKTAACNPCRANTFTLDFLNGTATSGYMDETDCLLAPGWGMDPTGNPEECQIGSWSVGFHRNPCTACPQGYTTLNTSSTSIAACVVQPGWEFDTLKNTVKPCDRGYFSTGGTTANPGAVCEKCTDGWTTQTQESTNSGDCNVCSDGYGDSGAGCQPCGYDTFGPGGQRDSCRACQASQTAMRGAWQVQQCVPRFPLVEASAPVYIPLSDEQQWVDRPAGANSEPECRSECNNEDTCILYRHKSTGGSVCSLLLASDPTLAGRAAVGFKAFAQGAAVDYSFSYVPASLDIGVLVKNVGSGLTMKACTAACDNDEGCVMVRATGSVAAGYTCSTFRGDLDPEWVSLYRIKGQNLLGDGLVVSTA